MTDSYAEQEARISRAPEYYTSVLSQDAKVTSRKSMELQEAKKDGETEQPKQVTRKYRLHPLDMWVLDE
ncbi:hypothetical protein PENSUB_7259 [Penicillium subrubescens]|uniref:Uncharacterized protein n=1 Tax=Penicillium subrubescens TaxID=1316194 RepID=A0A1Q5TM38_9EURO|nr:hypothetical protein PENSUB_7259 [Penicillium subrubescens]